MNMNLADMNNVITNLAHQEKPGLGSRHAGRIRGKGTDFSSNLDREIQKIDTPDESVAGQGKYSIQVEGGGAKKSRGLKSGLKSLTGLNTASVNQEGMDAGKKKNGLKFLSELENVILQLSGGDLNTVSISSEGLDTL